LNFEDKTLIYLIEAELGAIVLSDESDIRESK
jgi:hypothetical protein